ncbi:MAG: hypothetical protein K2Q03_03355 [Sphingobacteriaceae bacterium]|nr:hypothetical protein [Sphingobacteriaceae bacterium]
MEMPKKSTKKTENDFNEQENLNPTSSKKSFEDDDDLGDLDFDSDLGSLDFDDEDDDF